MMGIPKKYGMHRNIRMLFVCARREGGDNHEKDCVSSGPDYCGYSGFPCNL